MSAAVITRAVLDRLDGRQAVPSPRPEPSDTQAVADS